MTPTLRDLIAGATPGPWEVVSPTNARGQELPPRVIRTDSTGGIVAQACLAGAGDRAANAELIARCNPATMLLVIEALDLAQQNYNRTNNDQPDDMGDDEHEAWGAILKALAALNSTPQNES